MKKRRITIIIVIAVVTLWLTGIIPMQIAKISGTSYVNKHFPEMALGCVGIEYADVFGDYLIAFEDKNGMRYSCVIGPELLPITLGQGLAVIEGEYEENYK